MDRVEIVGCAIILGRAHATTRCCNGPTPAGRDKAGVRECTVKSTPGDSFSHEIPKNQQFPKVKPGRALGDPPNPRPASHVQRGVDSVSFHSLQRTPNTGPLQPWCSRTHRGLGVPRSQNLRPQEGMQPVTPFV